MATPTRLAFNPTTGLLDLVLQDPAQVVTVAKSGAQFTSIQAAIDSITDATAAKVYGVLVSPGAYTENLTLKPFVTLVGETNGPAAPTIVGTVVGTFTNAGEWTLINRMSIVRTIAADGEIVVNITGGIAFNDVFIDASTASNLGFTALSVNATTFPSALFVGQVQARSTFSGSTKNITAVSMTGTQDWNCANFQIIVSALASSGTLIGRTLNGSGEYSGIANNIRVTNGAAFSGTAIGMQNTTTTTAFRIEDASQVRLRGVSGGTSVCYDLNSAGNSATAAYANGAVFSTGFTNEYVCRTALGDTQNIWLNSANKTLSKNGAGLANVTPFDDVKTGFSEWSSTAGNFWSFTSSTGTFSNLKRFIGQVKNAPVVAAASQTLTGATAIPDLATSYIYADSTGVLKSTTTGSAALFEDNIPMFEVWRDGSNYLMSRENHPYKFGTAVATAWHDQFGSLLQKSASSLGVGLAGAKCAFTGENVIGDHGITSTVAEAAAGFTATFVYVDGAGKMRWYATSDTFPAYYNKTGTPELLTVGSNRWVVYRVGVIKDSGLTGSDTAQFVAVMDTVQNTSTGNATARITANTVASFPPELVALEVCQVGFVVVRKTSVGAIDTTNVPPTTSLQVFSAAFIAGGTSTSSTLITTNTTDFDTILSGTDTNVQLALDTIDDTAAKRATSSTDNALVRFDGVTGQLIQDSVVTATDTGEVESPSTSHARLAVGTTGQRPAATAGNFRFNTTTSKFEGADGTNWQDLGPSDPRMYAVKNAGIAATAGSNALTIALKTAVAGDPSTSDVVKIGFRSTAATTTGFNERSVTAALSLVVSAGSTLGGTSGASDTYYVYAVDSDGAGAVKLAISKTLFDSGTLQTTVAEGGAGAADTATTLYSDGAYSSKPVRLLARIKATQTTGNWSAVAEISLLPLYNTATDQEPGLYKAGAAPGVVGSAPQTGCIGEKIQATLTATTPTASEGDVTGASISLTPGQWRIFYAVDIGYQTGASASDRGATYVRITDSANTLIGTSSRTLFVRTPAAALSDILVPASSEEIVTVSSTTTYKLRAKRTDTSGTGTASVSAGTFYAVRIA